MFLEDWQFIAEKLPNLLTIVYNIGPGYVESWSPAPASGCES
jgi:hypothetical protein